MLIVLLDYSTLVWEREEREFGLVAASDPAALPWLCGCCVLRHEFGPIDWPVNGKDDIGDLILNEVSSVHAMHELRIDTSTVLQFVGAAHVVPFGRAVRNLLENAVRHADATVVISSKSVGSLTVVTVEDDGPGVPSEDRLRVFDRFVRLDSARSRAGGGSGLGLAIVASIANLHNGTIICDESETLGGARFVLAV